MDVKLKVPKITTVPSKDSDQGWHMPNLIGDLAVSMKIF